MFVFLIIAFVFALINKLKPILWGGEGGGGGGDR